MSSRLVRQACGLPANDNGSDRTTTDALLHAALRGGKAVLGEVAQRARKQAEAAFFAGDRQSYQWWLEICRTLDRRMASELDARAKP